LILKSVGSKKHKSLFFRPSRKKRPFLFGSNLNLLCFYLVEKGQIILQAKNPDFQDILIPPGRKAWIAGKMVGLIRKY